MDIVPYVLFVILGIYIIWQVRRIRHMRRAHFIDEPVHDAFGLSYASYYVMPRVVLQSMPVDWQRQWVALSEQIHSHLDYEDPDYCVLRCASEREEYDEEQKDMVHCTETCPRYVFDPLSEYRHNRIERRKPA